MRRAGLVGTVILLVGCVGYGTRGGQGERAAACEWDVCVYEASSHHALEVWVRNEGPIVATVTLTFDVLRNLRLTDALPIVHVVPPGGREVVARLERVDTMASMGAHPIVAIDLGSDSTQPDPDVLYAMPFGGSKARELIAGWGSPTHLGTNYYAVDFGMPEGTPVLAAREGIVVQIQDGFTKGGLRPELLDRANLVVVAHRDGTLASYGHLLPGLRVAEGDSVERGQLLGYSGATGFAGVPHLHFHVGKRLVGGDNRTIPFELLGPDGGPLDPVEGEWYEPGHRSSN